MSVPEFPGFFRQPDAASEAHRRWPEGDPAMDRWDGLNIDARRSYLVQRQAFEAGAVWQALSARAATRELIANVVAKHWRTRSSNDDEPRGRYCICGEPIPKSVPTTRREQWHQRHNTEALWSAINAPTSGPHEETP